MTLHVVEEPLFVRQSCARENLMWWISADVCGFRRTGRCSLDAYLERANTRARLDQIGDD
jgi:hypothetical protein